MIDARVRTVPGKQAESSATCPSTAGPGEQMVFCPISAAARDPNMLSGLSFEGRPAAQLQV
ncbi:MAG TPA: hypothetical protein DD666_16650 [Advenella kashmirensis]|uniref:Uncharacterized protein n=1 Tax=Advenella kashmirensis TaxID=310575 RepID=A0A356LJ44_9BURK|nr:hypothetical protein [Advenella kashmirensis]